MQRDYESLLNADVHATGYTGSEWVGRLVGYSLGPVVIIEEPDGRRATIGTGALEDLQPLASPSSSEDPSP